MTLLSPLPARVLRMKHAGCVLISLWSRYSGCCKCDLGDSAARDLPNRPFIFQQGCTRDAFSSCDSVYSEWPSRLLALDALYVVYQALVVTNHGTDGVPGGGLIKASQRRRILEGRRGAFGEPASRGSPAADVQRSLSRCRFNQPSPRHV